MIQSLTRLLAWRSLRTRIALALVGVILALGLMALWQSFRDLSDILGRGLEQRGIAIARDLAARSASPAVVNDVFGLYELINDSLINNQEVRYIYLAEAGGEIRVHTFPHGLPPGLSAANPLQPGARQQVQLIRTNEGPVLDVAVPVITGQGDVIHVGMSMSTVERQVRDYIGYLALLLAAACLVAVILSVLFTNVVTRPLTRLVEEIKQVARGNFDSKVPVKAVAEMADVAVAFNHMTEALVKHRQDLVERNTELEILNTMADNLSRQITFPQVLSTSLDTLLSLTGLAAGWVCLRNESDELEIAVSVGVLPLDGRKARGPGPADCSCRQVLETGQSAVLVHAPHCPLLAANLDGLSGRLALPLRSREGVLGVLNVASPSADDFPDGRVRLLTSVGQQIGVAIENARLYAELQSKEEARGQLLDKLIAAQEDERKRIAREIHDEPTQSLSAVIMHLDQVEHHLTGAQETERRQVRMAQRAVRAAVENLHRIMTELRPQALDDLGFVPAIRWYAEQRLQENGIELDIAVRGFPDRLDPQLETAVFRVMQEAIGNVCRHAQATRVKVRLEFGAEGLRGLVEDNGRGSSPEALRYKPGQVQGLGILGMQERIGLFGGTLSVASKPGKGTRVTFTIPLRGRSESIGLQDSRSGG